MEIIISILIGYLLGSVNPAYICGRLHGFDIRTRGTGNCGASNAKICLGWPYFVLVLVYDALKAIVSILIVRYLYASEVLEVLAGISTIFGHCFPFYLRFKGGKGYATYIGLAAILDWKACAVIIVLSMIIALIMNYIVVGTVSLTVSFPLYYLYLQKSYIVVGLLAITSLMILYKHIENFVRYYNGEEFGINGKPVGIKKKVQ